MSEKLIKHLKGLVQPRQNSKRGQISMNRLENVDASLEQSFRCQKSAMKNTFLYWAVKVGSAKVLTWYLKNHSASDDINYFDSNGMPH